MFCMTPCAWQRFTHVVGKYSSQTFQGMTLVFVFCIIWVGWFVWDFRFAACKQGCHFLSFLGPAFHAFCHLLGYSARVTTGAISGTLTLDSLRSRLAIHVRKGGRTHLCIGPLGRNGQTRTVEQKTLQPLGISGHCTCLFGIGQLPDNNFGIFQVLLLSDRCDRRVRNFAQDHIMSLISSQEISPRLVLFEQIL